MIEDFDYEYKEMLWKSFLAEHKDADEDAAIRFWAQIHLVQVYWMSTSDVLDALTHLYNYDKAKALDTLVARREKQAVEY